MTQAQYSFLAALIVAAPYMPKSFSIGMSMGFVFMGICFLILKK